jgi:hypothetical protein
MKCRWVDDLRRVPLPYVRNVTGFVVQVGYAPTPQVFQTRASTKLASVPDESSVGYNPTP